MRLVLTEKDCIFETKSFDSMNNERWTNSGTKITGHFHSVILDMHKTIMDLVENRTKGNKTNG